MRGAGGRAEGCGEGREGGWERAGEGRGVRLERGELDQMEMRGGRTERGAKVEERVFFEKEITGQERSSLMFRLGGYGKNLVGDTLGWLLQVCPSQA